jgi:hypothetical protein
MNRSRFSIVAVCSLAFVFVAGCGSNPTLSQPAYQQAMALFNAVSRKDQAALSKLRDLITQASSDAEISTAEANLLLAVIENAQQGNWDSATARMRKLMERQASAAPSNLPPGEPQQRHRH